MELKSIDRIKKKMGTHEKNRLTIRLTEDLFKDIAELCKRKGWVRADAGRRALELLLERYPEPTTFLTK